MLGDQRGGLGGGQASAADGQGNVSGNGLEYSSRASPAAPCCLVHSWVSSLVLNGSLDAMKSSGGVPHCCSAASLSSSVRETPCA